MKTKFELRREITEVDFKDRNKIKEGLFSEQENRCPDIIVSFDSLEEAQAELKNYKSSIRELSGGSGKYYSVTEFYIEKNIYDDGEWVDGGEIYDFSKIKIELVEKPSYRVLGTFDNMEDAIKAFNSYDGDDEVYLSF